MNTLQGTVRLVGDIHGKPHAIPANPEHADHIILLGDIGLGFRPNTDNEPFNEAVEEGRTEELLELIHKYAIKGAGGNENVQIWLLRGNHDNPGYWNGSSECAKNVYENVNLDELNIHLLQDEFITINGKKWFVFGGGVSVDVAIRTDGFDYWHDEIISDFADITPEHVEGILSHVGTKPPCVEKTPNAFIEKIIERTGPQLHAAIARENSILESLYTKFTPSRWIYAHWHVGESFMKNDCAHVVLNAEFTPRYEGLKEFKTSQTIDIQ